MSLPQEEQDFFRAFGCYLQSQADQSPTMPANVSKPLPSAPRASDVVLTAAATAFIGNHTAPDADVPKEDECPICLDIYSDAPEPCLRVKGKAGCTCRIGLVCLGEMLSKSPEKEKRCPLCRASWMASTAPPPQTAHPDGMVNPDTVGRSSREAHPPRTSSLSHASRLSATANPFMPRRIAPTPVIDMSQDDAGDDYSELTRDIESVRARARGTQSSRSQRRQEVRDQNIQREQELRDLIAESSPFFRNSSGGRTASIGAPAPPRRAQDAIAGAFFTPSAADRPTIAARRGSVRPASIRPPIQLGPGALLLPPANVTPTPKPVASAQPKAAPGPSRPSRSEEQNKEYQERSSELDARKTELVAREQDLDMRDFHLDGREDIQEKANNNRKAGLDALESILNKRSKVLNEREIKVAKQLTMVQEHREEMKRMLWMQKDAMKDLVQKQKEEMKTAIKRQQNEMDRL